MSGMISGALTRFKAALVSTLGAGQVGYDAAAAYVGNTVGAAIKAANTAITNVGNNLATLGANLTAFISSLQDAPGAGLVGYDNGQSYAAGTLGAIVKTLSNPSQVIGVINGSFTPVVTGSVNAGFATWVTRTGHYWKIGPITFVNILVAWSGHNGQGDLLVDIPGTATNAGGNVAGMLQAQVFGFTPALNASDTMVFAVPVVGQAKVRIQSQLVGGGAHPYAIDGSTGSVQISGWYVE